MQGLSKSFMENWFLHPSSDRWDFSLCWSKIFCSSQFLCYWIL